MILFLVIWLLLGIISVIMMGLMIFDLTIHTPVNYYIDYNTIIFFIILFCTGPLGLYVVINQKGKIKSKK